VDAGAIRLGGCLGERALEILEGRKQPAEPRNAATVMLLRPAKRSISITHGAPGHGTPSPGSAAGGVPGGDAGPVGGLEVYMLRRKSSMAFAPGAFVFPGGSVDARDADEKVAWAGPDPAEWGRVFDAPPELACALVCAAVRETFEESGVLLAGPSADTVVADTTSLEWEADRNALLDRSLSLAELLGRRGLVLRSDLLRPWSRWITPVIEERRFDTRFFAAALPGAQAARDVGGEAAEVAWVRPDDAIAAGRRKEIVLFPPTAVSLAELAACPDVAAALRPRQVRPLLPEASVANGAVWLTMPADVEYPL
jgi:8-oxo-dGTP pyrophosphatase MutT (NUDIX family)